MIETIALRILRTVRLVPGAWTARILAHRLGLELREVESGVRWLREHGFMTSTYWLTSDGAAWYEDQIHDVRLRAPSTQAWKDEALTGITSAGKPTAIENAALSTRKAPRTVSLSTASAVYIRELAKQLGIEVRELGTLYADGLIKMCPGWDGQEHIGVFHRLRKGQSYTRALCIECRKRTRRR